MTRPSGAVLVALRLAPRRPDDLDRPCPGVGLYREHVGDPTRPRVAVDLADSRVGASSVDSAHHRMHARRTRG